jgi:hypothetical protein
VNGLLPTEKSNNYSLKDFKATALGGSEVITLTVDGFEFRDLNYKRTAIL